jgi:hypothetical protein
MKFAVSNTHTAYLHVLKMTVGAKIRRHGQNDCDIKIIRGFYRIWSIIVHLGLEMQGISFFCYYDTTTIIPMVYRYSYKLPFAGNYKADFVYCSYTISRRLLFMEVYDAFDSIPYFAQE